MQLSCYRHACNLLKLQVLHRCIMSILRSPGCLASLAGDGKPHTFVSRFFAPWAGILEDAVTGSAHALLAPYWARQLGSEGPMHARQCSKRGGELGLQLQDDSVLVSAQAVLVLNGSMALCPP